MYDWEAPRDAIGPSSEVWFWRSDAGWEPYCADANAAIAAARGSKLAEVTLPGGQYTLSLSALVQRRVGDASRCRKVTSLNVCWEFDGDAGWEPYALADTLLLEEALQQSAGVCRVLGGTYEVDLVALRQHAVANSFRCRAVRRRAERPLNDARRELRTSRGWVDLRPPPSCDGFWTRSDVPEALRATIEGWMCRCIRTGHAPYGLVAGTKAAPGRFEVVKAEAAWSPGLWRRYAAYRAQRQSASSARLEQVPPATAGMGLSPGAGAVAPLDASVHETYLWHGTGRNAAGTVDVVEEITSAGCSADTCTVAEGMSSRFAKPTGMFGRGIYLADLSSKANLYVPCPVCNKGCYFRAPCTCSGKKVTASGELYRMLLCRAVLGRVYVEEKYNGKRYKGDFNPAEILDADSVLAEPGPGTGLAFREYILYDDRSVYPEFIVYYRRKK